MAILLDTTYMRTAGMHPLLTANPANFAKSTHCYKLAKLAEIAVSKPGNPCKRCLTKGGRHG